MQEKSCCVVCGEELTNENYIGVSNTCVVCQSKRFGILEAANGTHMALFQTCAAFDIVFDPSVVPIAFSDFDGDKWDEYLGLLAENEKLRTDDTIRGFDEGETNVREIFGVELSDRDFGRYVAREQSKVQKMPGTEAQRTRWGTLPIWKGVPVSKEIYDELDRRYQDAKKSYNGLTFTPQMDSTLVYVTKMRVAATWLMSSGNPNYEKLLKSADAMLASEQMRRKDEKQKDALRIDDLIDDLEKAGLLKDGEFLTFDQTKQVLADLLKTKKYDYSLDVADQIIYLCANSMRENEDMSLLSELPEEMKTEDFHGEFLPEETEKEREAKRYAGLTKIPRKQGNR
ncbi:MAG: hypothetical protein J6V22_07075 [Clostridia bacterium]|nr:hypothetical protein [Clostridia bacterium]